MQKTSTCNKTSQRKRKWKHAIDRMASLSLFSSGGQGWNISCIWFAYPIESWFLGIEKLLRKNIALVFGLHVRFHTHHPFMRAGTQYFGRDEILTQQLCWCPSHPTLHLEVINSHGINHKINGGVGLKHKHIIVYSVHIIYRYIHTNKRNTYVHECAMQA